MASGERTIRIKFDGSTSGLTTAAAKARAELKALEKQTDTNKKNLSKFSSGVGGIASNLARAAVMLSSLSSGVGVIMALSSGLVAASGAAFLLPAALGVAAAALLTTKLGADGIKAAFDRLTPTLDTLKAKVSASFESSLLPAVNNLRGVLPKLTSGFQQIATAMGGFVTHVTSLIKTPAAIGQLNAILSGTARMIKNIGAFLAPVIAGFITLAAAAIPSLTQLTTGLGNVGDRFQAWTDRVAAGGFVTEWIQGSLDLFKSLWGVLKDLAGIVGDVFSAAEEAGGGFSGTLGALIKTVREFLDSAQGRDTLVAVFQALNAVGDAVSRVLGAALKAVAPVLPPLLDAFSQLATQVASFLVPAITALSPILAGLATFLAANMSWLGPIAIAVGAVAAAIWLVNAAIGAWEVITGIMTAVQWALNAALFANPIGLIILAIAALIAIIVLIVSNLDFFRGVWDAVWKFCSDVITAVWNWIKGNWPLLLTILTGPIGAAVAFIITHWNQIRDVVGGIINWFRNAWNGAVDAVAGFFSGLAGRVSGAFQGVVGAVKSAINGVIRFVNGAINGVNNVTGLVGIPSIPNIPYLAKGGTAVGGRAYLVGEQGPELFTPGRTGRVTNASTTAEAMGGGGAQTINLTLDLGEGIQQAFEIKTTRDNRSLVRAVTAGAGGSR